MIRPIDIRLNAAHPELPLAEAVTFTGSPSTVLIRGVPPNCGRWAITAVSVAASFPDGSTTTRAAVQSANGVWVATLPATATSGRTANGIRVMADGIDENGDAVTGYILGVADFAVASLDVTPAPEPGGTAYALRYFDTLPDPAKKGDVIRVNGDLKFYNGTAWQPFTDLSNYYTAEQVDEAIDKLAAYYITADAQGNPFATKAALVNAQTYYSGGAVRIPTRNDYAVVSADETHGGAEWRYIYAVDAQGVGQWEPQYAVEGVIAYDDTVTRTSANGVKSSGIWAAIWGALSALPTGFTSLYDWCVSQLAGKADKSDVDPLLFAQYYPEGNVKSAAEFTPGIKYNDPDTIDRTITVKPFCATGDSENDNSSLVGRVVIPPFVDGDGNPYISDDGTRFKVVGVSDGAYSGPNENLITIIAPNTVTIIRSAAFADCTSLASVSLPAVTNVSSAFGYCTSLTSVSLPVATSIGDFAFADCTSLASVSLPVAMSIGEYVFLNCTSLASVDFGNTPRSSVPSLGSGAFSYVPTACRIIVPYTQYDAWIAADGWKDLPQEFVRHSEKADKPATYTAGNLAALDASGNPTDAGWTAGDLARYALTTKTIDNSAVTLDDRASNAVTVSATLSPNTLTINFPTADSGKARDFAMRLNIAAGVTAPEIAWPQGVTLENKDGEAPEIADGGTGGSSTILYFSETENNGTTAKFLVKGETLTAIAQA